MANLKNEKQSFIKKEQLVQLLRCGLTRQQICDFFGVDRLTLQRYIKKNFDGATFEEVKAENEAYLRAGIMSNLINLSKKNASVAIFLAKSVCGLSETASAPPNEEAGLAFTTALKRASRSIGNSEGLATVPTVGEAETYQEEDE